MIQSQHAPELVVVLDVVYAVMVICPPRYTLGGYIYNNYIIGTH
jgi:hypothetical protein